MKQLSIFTETKKGAIKKIFDILAKADVGIRASVTNDSAEFGIIRLIVTDAAAADTALKEAGYLTKVSEVLGVEIPDENGSLARMLGILEDMNVNVDYIYLCYNRATASPIMVFSCEAMDEVSESLSLRGLVISN